MVRCINYPLKSTLFHVKFQLAPNLAAICSFQITKEALSTSPFKCISQSEIVSMKQLSIFSS